MHFIAPNGAALPAPAPAVPGGSGGRLSELVRAAITNRPARSAVPRLLRGFSEELTTRLLRRIPLEPASETSRSVRDALAAAGIRTVAQLLDSHPEDIHVDVLERASAAGLAELLETSEKTAASLARAVGDMVQRFASEGRLVSREDMRSADVAPEFQKALGEALKGAVPSETVAAEVDAAATRG